MRPWAVTTEAAHSLTARVIETLKAKRARILPWIRARFFLVPKANSRCNRFPLREAENTFQPAPETALRNFQQPDAFPCQAENQPLNWILVKYFGLIQRLEESPFQGFRSPFLLDFFL